MYYRNYQTLVNIMRTQKPFRGTQNKFPLTNRKLSYKYFLQDKDENGQDMFRLVYGKRWDRELVTQMDYELANGDKSGEYFKRPNDDGEMEYFKYVESPNEMGIVRADNSFEFTKSAYGQGDMYFLNDYCRKGYFYTDSRRGGMLYVTGGRKQRESMLPIFKGLRVDCDTMQPDPSHTYKLYGRRVNRKESKEFLKQYEDFFKVSEAMMKTISMENFVAISNEFVSTTPDSRASYWIQDKFRDELLAKAKELMNDSPLDAAAILCLTLGSRGIGNFRWISLVTRTSSNDTPAEYFLPMKRAVCSMLYTENPDVMKLIEYEYGKPYPQSIWGYAVEVDGVLVEQL